MALTKQQYSGNASSGSSGGGSSSSGSSGSSGGSSGGSLGGTGYNNGSLTSSQIKELQNALGVSADGKYGPDSKKAAGGLSAEEAYKKYVGSGKKTTSSFTGSSYNEAVAYAKANGVPSGHASGIMTASEWNRRKSSYQTTGQGGAEVKNYKTYKEYLADITAYLVEKYN
jgi:hypothetical protein